MGRLYTKGLVDDIKTYGHPGRFSKVTKWTGGRTFFTSSTSASVNRGPGYGAGAVIISGSKSNFDQEAYIKMTGGGAILIKDLATTDAADAQSQMFYELSVAEISGCAAGNSVTRASAPNKGVEVVHTGVVYVLHKNARVS